MFTHFMNGGSVTSAAEGRCPWSHRGMRSTLRAGAVDVHAADSELAGRAEGGVDKHGEEASVASP